MENIKRQEYKYFINNADVVKLKTLLGSVLDIDSNAAKESNEYTISSLYFETPDDRDLDEKLDGLLVREKHRIRIYNHDYSTIKLETKKRNATVIHKDSTIIKPSTAKCLIAGNYNIKDLGNELLKTICIKFKSSFYKPRVIVQYDREAYYLPYGNIRITFDKNLSTYNTHCDLFNLEDVPTSPAFLNNHQILEVKFDIELPFYLNSILQTVPLIRSSISKYVLCQRFTDHNPWRDCLIPPY